MSHVLEVNESPRDEMFEVVKNSPVEQERGDETLLDLSNVDASDSAVVDDASAVSKDEASAVSKDEASADEAMAMEEVSVTEPEENFDELFDDGDDDFWHDMDRTNSEQDAIAEEESRKANTRYRVVMAVMVILVAVVGAYYLFRK